MIGAGRYCADGLLVENEAATLYFGAARASRAACLQAGKSYLYAPLVTLDVIANAQRAQLIRD